MRPLALAALLCVAAAPMTTPVTTPAPGPVRVIGGQGAGCIAGAVRLPDDAPGMQAIRLSHSSLWGHPDTIAALEQLGAEAHAAGLPDLYMGDISDPRGGPLRGGHFSHQMGIDADVWLDLTPPHPRLPLAEREDLLPPSMVSADGRGTDPAHWGPAQATLLRLAATLPHVDRVLVNPAIKRALCRQAGTSQAGGDRAWLRLIRPWWGHASHMHIHFACPAGQPACRNDVPPIPAGDGCDASLDWWFAQLDAPPRPPARPAAPQPLPAACRAVFAAP